MRYSRVGLDFEAVEVLAQDDVGNARDRVRTVYRGRAVEQQVILLNQRGRYEIEVRRNGRTLYARRRQAATVDENQGSRGTESAQVDRRRARAVIENEALERQVDLLAAGRSRFLQDIGCINEADFAGYLSRDDLQR